MIKDKKQPTPYIAFMQSGTTYLTDLAAQTLNIIVEFNKVGQNTTNERSNDITFRALESSATMLAFQFLESTISFITDMTLKINEQYEGAPTPKRNLHSFERDFLREEETFFNGKKGETTTRTVRHQLLESAYGVPYIHASIFGKPSPIDKNHLDWKRLVHFVKIRNRIAHPSAHVQFTIQEIVNTILGTSPSPISSEIVTMKELFDALGATYWYFDKVSSLIVSSLEVSFPFPSVESYSNKIGIIYRESNENTPSSYLQNSLTRLRHASLFRAPLLVLRLCLINMQGPAKISNELLNKLYPWPSDFRIAPREADQQDSNKPVSS